MNFIVKMLTAATALALSGCAQTLQGYVSKDYVPVPSPAVTYLIAGDGTNSHPVLESTQPWIRRYTGTRTIWLSRALEGVHHKCRVMQTPTGHWKYTTIYEVVVEIPGQETHRTIADFSFESDVVPPAKLKEELAKFLAYCNADYLPAGPGS